MQAERTAIQGGWVIGWGDDCHQVFEGGTVVIEGDRILFAGFPSDPACPMADKVIDARCKLVSPGLINLHGIANLDLQVLRSDVASSGYSRPRAYVVDPAAPHIWSDEDFRVSTEFSVATMLKAGNTSFATVTTGATKRWEDPETEPHALAEAANRLGARAWVCHSYMESSGGTLPDGTREVIWDRNKAQAGLDRAIGLIKHLRDRGDGRVTGFLFPYQTAACSADLLQETMRQSKLLGGIHVRSHFAQYIGEYRDCKAKYGFTPVQHMADIGFVGPQVCLTHAIYTAGHSATGDPPGEDLQILAATGTSVAHCPVVFARGGVALESFSRYFRAGINMGLGCDTFPPDLVEEMRIGALINKVVDRGRGAGTVREFFHAATVGGARALGRSDLGRLAVGCTADISIFHLSGLAAGPIDDPLRTFVHFGGGWDCDTVLVGGKVVVADGRVLGVDEAALAARAQPVWDKYKAGLVAWDYLGRSADQVFPPALPIVRRQS